MKKLIIAVLAAISALTLSLPVHASPPVSLDRAAGTLRFVPMPKGTVPKYTTGVTGEGWGSHAPLLMTTTGAFGLWGMQLRADARGSFLVGFDYPEGCGRTTVALRDFRGNRNSRVVPIRPCGPSKPSIYPKLAPPPPSLVIFRGSVLWPGHVHTISRAESVHLSLHLGDELQLVVPGWPHTVDRYLALSGWRVDTMPGCKAPCQPATAFFKWVAMRPGNTTVTEQPVCLPDHACPRVDLSVSIVGTR